MERRENFLEDQSELNLFKQGKVSPTDFFNYYLGYIGNPSITNHYHPVPDFRRAVRPAVGDEHRDPRPAAGRQGRRSERVATSRWAVTRWAGRSRPPTRPGTSTAGQAGSDLSGPRPDRRREQPDPGDRRPGATTSLDNLQTSSPWLAFGGIPAPLAGLFGTVGSAPTKARPEHPLGLRELAVPALEPEASRRDQSRPMRPASATTTDAATSPSTLRAAQVHSGHLAASGDPRGWVRAGAITPIQRWASMFSGWGLQNLDGTAWYHPLRLTIDSGAVGDGVANPAQSVLDVHSTDASKLPKRLRIYAFGAALGGPNVPARGAGAGRHGRDPEQEPEAGQPAGDLRPQRSERRAAEGERLLQAADPVPAEDQRGEDKRRRKKK